jgi:hypothetical protein
MSHIYISIPPTSLALLECAAVMAPVDAETSSVLALATPLPVRAAISFFRLRAANASCSFLAAAADLGGGAAATADMLLLLLADVSSDLLELLTFLRGAWRRQTGAASSLS